MRTLFASLVLAASAIAPSAAVAQTSTTPAAPRPVPKSEDGFGEDRPRASGQTISSLPLTPPATTTVSADIAAPVPSGTWQENPAGREIAATTVAPTASITESEARQVIEAYYAAYRARDFKALRAIFPDAPDVEKKRIEALRKDDERCDYIVWGLTARQVSASRAIVRIDVTQVCRPRNRALARKVGTRCTFWLGPSAYGRWIITRGPAARRPSAT